MRRLTVAVDPPYDVVVGRGALGEVAGVLRGRRQVAILTQATVAHIAEDVAAALTAASVEVRVFTIGDGEPAKSLATVESTCRELATWGLLRGDAIAAVGGGVVGDTAGFVASVYYRGIDVVQVPTTLLAMVDAAIGGKTAVNLPEGKNLVGAFHQPIAVLADVTTLETLPEREYRAGLGEIVKYALMPEGGAVLRALETEAEAVAARDADVMASLVAECAAIKASVVAADPHERTGIRATLNYGHTLAHALETTGDYDLLHGEAVAVGLVFADALAVSLQRLDSWRAEEHRAVLGRLGLPTTVPPGADPDALLTVMRRDKKAAGGLSFVLPSARGLERVDDPPSSALARAFRAVGVDAEMGD